ncbi:MAG: nicotinamide-nucleotide amidase [Anaerophaga sp.]|uniref:competence/damage-inducible protein A n=1 Tax=Anaerophaga thermohalophila TaxID=177400 RepID=UPI000237BD2F|nr:competence/damage-inducible protein A [Anaerophaga thermohalophila]MDK2842364.1 nicotinamide-nucleotide amidase [Anaerophaga sp.]MDN5292618.1 nicotinamide-nucleotide amidase [Anaerophaga sp.]
MVEIITIGDELLIGQVVDTNSAWMARELNQAGFEVNRITSVSDRKEEIQEALESAARRAKIVLMTGGLGPTRDDITKQTLCDFFNTRLVFNEEVYNDIREFLKGRVKNINQLNRDQAMVPEKCMVIRNKLGTAPVMWFEYNNSVVVSMPGVPAEMKLAMTDEIIPRLKEKYEPGVIIHKTVLIYNIPEAVLAEKLTGWEEQLPDEIKLAYLPAPGRVRLRLTTRGNDPDALRKSIQKAVDALYPIVGENIYGEEDQPASEIFANYFRSTGKTIALAESCSGGYLAHLITMVPGSSDYFKGSMVTYSNDLKINILGVKPEDIENYGAVSRQVVEQMALGAVRIAESDYAIAISGIAGPGGGSEEKPVGTVWMAWAGPGNKVVSKEFRFGKERERNIVQTSETALIELMRLMKQGIL